MKKHGELRKDRGPNGPEAWLDVPVGRGWIASYRLRTTTGGSLEVIELRLRPAAAIEVHGGLVVDADTVVPPTGLTSRDLRDVKVTAHLSGFPDLNRKVRTILGVDTKPLRARRSLTKADANLVQRPGRAGRDKLELARIAARYTGFVEDGSRRPIEDLTAELCAKGRDVSSATVRGFIHDARRAGLLTPTPKGRAGGDLTDEAVRLLNEAFHRNVKTVNLKPGTAKARDAAKAGRNRRRSRST
jgi:hypothetical protein